MPKKSSSSGHTGLISSPVGPLWIETTLHGIRRLEFTTNALGLPRDLQEPKAGPSDEASLAAEVERQIAGYFDGSLKQFDLPLDLQGSEFQLGVWNAIGNVPFGETLTYGQIAASIGRPTSYRAVGNACGANPVVIVLPCHRIVGTDRSLHGFGGGIGTKTWLLRHEGAIERVKDKRVQQTLTNV